MVSQQQKILKLQWLKRPKTVQKMKFGPESKLLKT